MKECFKHAMKWDSGFWVLLRILAGFMFMWHGAGKLGWTGGAAIN